MKRSFFAESKLYMEVKTGGSTKLGFVSAEFVESNGLEFVMNSRTT